MSRLAVYAEAALERVAREQQREVWVHLRKRLRGWAFECRSLRSFLQRWLELEPLDCILLKLEGAWPEDPDLQQLREILKHVVLFGRGLAFYCDLPFSFYEKEGYHEKPWPIHRQIFFTAHLQIISSDLPSAEHSCLPRLRNIGIFTWEGRRRRMRFRVDVVRKCRTTVSIDENALGFVFSSSMGLLLCMVFSMLYPNS